MVFTYTLYL
ncbi:hypothetical protein D030_1402A, partial [Vibrio parahaemolyticus AQ3810]